MSDTTRVNNQKINWFIIQQRQKSRMTETNLSDIRYRKQQLATFKLMLENNQDELLNALYEDLGKSPEEAYVSEIAVLLQEIDFMKRELTKWQRPKRKRHVRLSSFSKTSIQHHPYGSVLIISPWNYPLHLALLPAIGAIAAGNSCFIKPSEYAPATAKLLAQLVENYFSPDSLVVVTGDASVASDLLELPWDFIFFTGSKKVGSIVYEAAAAKQIPIVLELGGKNPCIVDETNLTPAVVQRIIWGKFLNAGQTCIAPDTVYVHESVYDKFLQLAADQIKAFYGSQPIHPSRFGRIAHDKQVENIVGYLKQGKIYYGGHVDTTNRFIEPTLLTDIPADSPILREEIFGPILPVIPYSDLATLVRQLKSFPDPLAVYVFSKDKKSIQFLKSELRSGAFSLNQVILHAVSSHSPFGGVGASGFGRYHGMASLDTFSYLRMDYENLLPFNIQKQYPPYQSNDINLLRKWRRWLF
ncbi:aldehyde dehydrogenase family protein [Carnobacterium inhibens]|uniref:Aldehyde dehydrogenase n=1 Tax=Carnobacterium inhibens subsp. gilichinskyi TaxID=1266845 RepID=U5SDV6_9LACT|nr:aldehyde dehydrogenase family protein [Carnobacterium inhibens]AGY82283.1 aldehyde dehydrogenase [Carnobacterium inhibens subsp. gilichinskyi]